MKDVVFVLMAKEPRAGETKTRLVPPLTHQQATALYQALLRDSIALLAGMDWADLAVAISPPGSEDYFREITPRGTKLLPITGVDIGDCLQQTLGKLLRMGYRKAIAVNADGPSLPAAYLRQAADSLEEHDLVLGEGHDGGYYLVGMKELHKRVFENIHWSTPRVLAQTLERATEAGLRIARTPQWYDVDVIEDLARLRDDLAGLPLERLVQTRRFLENFQL